MIKPISIIGNPVLKKKAVEIDADYPNLKNLITDMYDTMESANGIGLAAPQIGLSIRMFVVDGSDLENIEPENFKQVFINPVMHEESGEKWEFEEGCLSIPGVREKVLRHAVIDIEYYDEKFQHYRRQFSGMAARIIQHEYDHIEGILFTDKINPLKKQLISGKLRAIANGKFRADYKTKLFQKR